MPLMRCKVKGARGYKWGESGKCYAGADGRRKALRQGRAIEASKARRAARNESADALGASRRDPTRTLTLRRRFEADLRRRFAALRLAAYKLIAAEDALGLRRPAPGPTRWAFADPAAKLTSLAAWLGGQILREIMSPPEWWVVHLARSYAAGATRSLADVRRNVPPRHRGGFPTKEALLARLAARPGAGGDRRSVFNVKWDVRDLAGRFMSRRVQLLSLRLENELAGATAAMSQRVAREVMNGLERGSTPLEVADAVTAAADVALSRALTIARTEMIRAHAEGQLDAMEELGVDELTALVEWAAGGGACPLCEDLDGTVLTVDEARGLIPVHPNCRCAWVPAP